MPLSWLRVERFRCLTEVELEPDARTNLFSGPNASGKTSLLEAIFFLGRGRSFRSRRLDALIQDGAQDFTVAGRAARGELAISLGVRGRRSGTEVRVGGETMRSAAELALNLPVQVIDPEIHKLLEEGPGRRRRFLDWGVFHVEQGFLATWQRYHRALKQRNAALRAQADRASVTAWDRELTETGEAIGEQRDRYLERLSASLAPIAGALLDAEVGLQHFAGWERERGLGLQLEDSLEKDRRYKATQVGPHRADIEVRLAGATARDRVSRGQQKMLASALALAQLSLQEDDRPGRSALLLDDPAAELDQRNLARLMAVVRGLRAQLWVTSLREEVPGLPEGGRRFHVEQGSVRPG